ncbi:acetylglutamate kinase [Sphingobacteriales bacterium CHB3]|nr:acetylglutamate kinase [Sphingobacteriales bacterium CHB3]
MNDNGQLRKEDVLVEALPYIQQFERTTFVIKYGGAAMEDEQLKQMVAQDVTLLRKIGIDIVVVHGGGKEITFLASRLNLETQFVNGQRYTDASTRDVVQMVLAGLINKDIVRRINLHNGNAIGLSGIDAKLLMVKRYDREDLGFVGEITTVNASFIRSMLRDGCLPVIAPLGVDGEGTVYNINADIAAGEIAKALVATKLIYMTDVEGIQVGTDLLKCLTESDAQNLIEKNVISGGMIPKVDSALDALKSGVGKVHIINGKTPHALLLEIFTTEGVGTEIVHQNGTQQ